MRRPALRLAPHSRHCGLAAVEEQRGRMALVDRAIHAGVELDDAAVEARDGARRRARAYGRPRAAQRRTAAAAAAARRPRCLRCRAPRRDTSWDRRCESSGLSSAASKRCSVPVSARPPCRRSPPRSVARRSRRECRPVRVSIALAAAAGLLQLRRASAEVFGERRAVAQVEFRQLMPRSDVRRAGVHEQRVVDRDHDRQRQQPLAVLARRREGGAMRRSSRAETSGRTPRPAPGRSPRSSPCDAPRARRRFVAGERGVLAGTT